MNKASVAHQHWIDKQGAGARGGGVHQAYLEVLSKVHLPRARAQGHLDQLSTLLRDAAQSPFTPRYSFARGPRDLCHWEYL